jgi:O-antigen/teichoic acid export membrane protein
MNRTATETVTWQEDHQARTTAMNVGARYVTLAIELMLGVVMLPFNTRHLGASEYGLWMLAASIVAYFPILDLGYGGAMERFVAHYRARKDAVAINEIASTLVFVFAGMALVAFVVATAIAFSLGTWFNLEPTRARTGGIVLLLVAAQLAAALPFSIFGAVVNGFQRTSLNSVVGAVVAVSVAAVNVVVLRSGGGLVELVAAMTAVRLLGCLAYRRNAYRVFPMLRIRPALFRRARLREATGFSVYMLIQDAANKVNYASDPIVIAAVLMTGAVAVWTVAQRLADLVLRLTNQLNESLFPVVVDCDSARRDDRLQELLLHGTRLSLATSIPAAGALALLAEPVVVGWTGPEFRAAAVVLEILALVVLVRVGSWTSAVVLQGGGHHRLLAASNVLTAAINIPLSILLVRTHGLPGVAAATLIAVLLRAFAVIPIACARARIPLRRFVSGAIWPAVWPAAIGLAGLAVVRDPASTSLALAVAQGAGVGVLHALLFVGFAIGRTDRNRYVGKLRSIAGWPALRTA